MLDNQKTLRQVFVISVLAVCLSVFAHSAGGTEAAWTYSGSGGWNIASYWSTGTIPNNTGSDWYNVTINQPGVTVSMNISPTINSLINYNTITSYQHTLTLVEPEGFTNYGTFRTVGYLERINGNVNNMPGGLVELRTGTRLYINGTWTNDGLVKVLSKRSTSRAFPSYLRAEGDTTFDGSGTLTLDTNTTYPNYGNYIGSYLRSDEGVTITNSVNHTIDGMGHIQAALVNYGTIRATRRTMYISTYAKTNRGRMWTDNAILDIRTTVDNTGGIIEASGGGQLVMSSGGHVTGGTFTGGGKFYINAGTSLTGVTMDGTTSSFWGMGGTLDGITITEGSAINAAYTDSYGCGTWTNNGTAYISEALQASTDLVLQGTGQLYGSGYKGDLKAGAGATITNAAGHRITGAMTFMGTIINNGTINANSGSGNMSVYGASCNLTNNGLISATGSGYLKVRAGQIGGTGSWLADGGMLFVEDAAQIETTGDIDVINDGSLYLYLGDGDPYYAKMSGRHFSAEQGCVVRTSWTQTLSLSGNLKHKLTNESDWYTQRGQRWVWDPDLGQNVYIWLSSMVEMTGGQGASQDNWAAWGSVEVAGWDKGNVSSGYTGNFQIPKLILTEGAHAYLSDLADNGNNWATGEALYVNELILGDGAVLNLNGRTLYYETLVGSTDQIIDVSVPEEAAYVPAGTGVGGSMLGGSAGGVGGMDVTFDNVTAESLFAVQYQQMDEQTFIDEYGQAGAVGLALPGFDTIQVWQIDFDNSSFDNCTLTLHYDDSDFPAEFDEADIAIRHYNPDTGEWELLGILAHDLSANIITVETSSFSPIVLVPEPATAAFLVLGAATLLTRRKRRRG